MRFCSSLLLLLALACGSSTEPAQDSSSGADAPAAGDCDYELGDPCITEENLAACQARAAECPGEVLVLESCPLQFACP
ncbi:MAG TPA: hypothetical protein RMH85_14920 [Polyangiaceae bacterium LLY-WYZ-15_(1-7)]|nr:hypothetical protein [Myxococcales bacterium]MAT28216.1 hypothetical protein [Sandaracinus sp.]HJK91498.1 hypothetical protein [Polyangiaceae bacterium LLY-WYZ-15_(1-7)]HJL05960.1 hypothetical protein [Polyangiaceae bacterium LLY-WYZ-15_(1-7)]HJL09789.1 hypothetical protein [Polyangiaceae bacterium LLY-WYZ-15_(1-7)]